MHEQYIKDLLDLKDPHLKIMKIEHQGRNQIIHLKFLQGYLVCPKCGGKTSKIKDYRIRKIKHGEINGHLGIIYYHRRRYECKYCHKIFAEPNSFVQKYAKISNLTKKLVNKRSEQVRSFKDIAADFNISSSTVIRILDQHTVQKRLPLSETIAIDEFKKTNLGHGKYAFIIVDPIKAKIIDVMKNRRSDWLVNYFNQIPLEERKCVKNVVMDLWSPYKTIVKSFFPNARIIADKFHFARYIYWAFQDVRIRIMNQYARDTLNYKVLKKYSKLFLKPSHRVSKTLNYMPMFDAYMSQLSIQDFAANIDPDLAEAFMIKDFFQSNMNQTSFDSAKALINQFIELLRHAKTKEFREIKKTFINWKEEIINSFLIHPITHKHMTNGITEGINNYIKVIKRVSYGYRNFERFRSRILFLFNKTYRLQG